MISYDDFKKLEIKIGTVLSAEKVPEADRLLKLMLDMGEEAPRQIISGIAEYYSDPGSLVGKQLPVLSNLEPRTIKGYESMGMILYAVEDSNLTTMEPAVKVQNGTRVS